MLDNISPPTIKCHASADEVIAPELLAALQHCALSWFCHEETQNGSTEQMSSNPRHRTARRVPQRAGGTTLTKLTGA